MTTKSAKAQETQENASDKDLELFTGFTREELKDITSFEDIEKLFAQRNVEIESASEELGDGFVVLEREGKDQLLGRTVMILSWAFSEGDFGEFVTARMVTRLDNGTVGKFIVNDGSTGLCRDLKTYTEGHKGRRVGLFAQHGLRKSEYMKSLPDPKTGEMKDSPAVTYYLDTSA